VLQPVNKREKISFSPNEPKLFIKKNFRKPNKSTNTWQRRAHNNRTKHKEKTPRGKEQRCN